MVWICGSAADKVEHPCADSAGTDDQALRNTWNQEDDEADAECFNGRYTVQLSGDQTHDTQQEQQACQNVEDPVRHSREESSEPFECPKADGDGKQEYLSDEFQDHHHVHLIS